MRTAPLCYPDAGCVQPVPRGARAGYLPPARGDEIIAQLHQGSSFFQASFRGFHGWCAPQRPRSALVSPAIVVAAATAFALENGAPSLVNSSVRTFSSDERGYDPARFPHLLLSFLICRNCRNCSKVPSRATGRDFLQFLQFLQSRFRIFWGSRATAPMDGLRC